MLTARGHCGVEAGSEDWVNPGLTSAVTSGVSEASDPRVIDLGRGVKVGVQRVAADLAY